jgi:hypothetical protein
VVRFDAVPVGLSSLVARRCRCGVLLRLDRRLGEDGGLNVSSGGLNHQPVPVLVELANAKAEIINDGLVLLTPGGEVRGGLLDVDEARVLVELKIDDPLLDRSVDFPKALV